MTAYLGIAICFFSEFLVYFPVHSATTNYSTEAPLCAKTDSILESREDTSDRLRRLRLRMKASGYHAYIVPSSDEHQSEFVADHDKRRRFISGFTGSAGVAVVTFDSAALWTDGRYFLQAEKELDCHWLLMRQGAQGVPTLTQWLGGSLEENRRVGADPKLIPYDKWLALEKELSSSGLVLSEDISNLIDDIWNIPQGRIPESVSRVFVHDVKYAGKTWNQKVLLVRQKLRSLNATATIVSALDEIAWLLNLRGSDVPYNPVFKSYVFITLNRIVLYIKPLKMTPQVREHLCPAGNKSECVTVADYQSAFEGMRQLVHSEDRILLPTSLSYALVSLVPEEKRLIWSKPSVIAVLKTVKNSVEIAGLKNAALKDSVAMADFIALLDEQVQMQKHWDELKAARTLSNYRREQELCQGDSFATISAVGSNAAVVHYRSRVITNRNINDKHVYLLDTGGQYLDGTTDITRTFHFGKPTDFEIAAYTRVLMGAIDLMSAVFPNGTTGPELDIIARLPLYNQGLNYLHGTGHGIGHFLNVHEGPPAIHVPRTCTNYPLEPGMFLSDEPGYYEENKFGIRLETMMMVVEAKTPYRFNQRLYYTFEPVSFMPFEPNLIDTSILTAKQIDWLNEFNRRARHTVGKELKRQGRDRGFRWLISKTKPICSADNRNNSESCMNVSISHCIVCLVVAFCLLSKSASGFFLDLTF